LKKYEKKPDNLNLYYDNINTIQPIIFRILISMCLPSFHNLPFNGQKAIIFEHISTGLIDNKYLTLYINDILNQTDRSTQINQEDLVEAFYSNLLVIKYSDLDDLVIKVQSLSYILNTESIKLVILDSVNLSLEQNIFNKNENDLDELRNRKSSFNMDNKARRSMNELDTRIYMNVFNVLENFQNKFNFGILNLFYDFERFPLCTSISFKMNRNPFYNISIENDPNLFHLKYNFEDENIEFLFKINSLNLDNRINIISPLNKNEQFFNDFKPFGIISLEQDSKAIFKFFIYSYSQKILNQISEENFTINE
jgi:hypothetical protein